jgi:hypothetical protein
METQSFPTSKEVQDTEVIKQDFSVCLLGQGWNFACRLPGKGATITAKPYIALLDKLKQLLDSKRRGKLSKGILFLQDNSAPHKAAITHQKLADLHFEVLKHQANSHDLAPSDYYLFLILKKHLKESKFSSINEATLAADGWVAAQKKNFLGLVKRI